MFLIYDDLCSNIEIKCKYNNIIDKIFILKFINKIFISKFINNINYLFIWLSRNRYYKIIKLLLKDKRVDPILIQLDGLPDLDIIKLLNYC
jgi:hypothetical protein